jgi:hypothetical protein
VVACIATVAGDVNSTGGTPFGAALSARTELGSNRVNPCLVDLSHFADNDAAVWILNESKMTHFEVILRFVADTPFVAAPAIHAAAAVLNSIQQHPSRWCVTCA